MNIRLFCSRAVPAILAISAITFTSCTVDQEAALFTGGSAAGKSEKEKTEEKKSEEKSESSFAEKMRIAKEERAKARAEAAEKKAKEKAEQEREEARKLAEKKKEEEALAKKEEAEKRAKEAEEKALAEKKAQEKREAEEEKARKLAEKKKAEEEKRAAKIAAREKARAERRAREAREDAEEEAANSREEVPAVAERRGRGGFFSRLSVSTPGEYKSEGHDVFVNQRLLSSLSPSNAKIEIDLSEQRARVYKNSGGVKQLVIDTQVSTGKSGHTTPTGTFRIKEKLVHKRSTLYGRWLNSSGATVRSDGDSRFRPAGGSQFIGAEMPYWMRVSGGVGMHIGYVPDYPASHGCIRVPSAVQPLIYSKVGVGTQVTITH